MVFGVPCGFQGSFMISGVLVVSSALYSLLDALCGF